jgi:hypothetical protein
MSKRKRRVKAAQKSAMDVFIFSDKISELTSRHALDLISSDHNLSIKLKNITSQKRALKEIYIREDIFKSLRDVFYVDGAIKITPRDIAELRSSMILLSKDKDGKRTVTRDEHAFDKYFDLLLRDQVYRKGEDLVFRNPKYYFLLDSVAFTAESSSTSINDYVLNDIDIKSFVAEIAANYNSAHQNLMLFSPFILKNLYECLEKSKVDFCLEIETTLSPKALKVFEEIIVSGKLSTGNAEFDTMYVKQWHHSIKALHHLRDLVGRYKGDSSKKTFLHIVRFLSMQTVAVEQARIEFGIDIDSVFNKYILPQGMRAMKKVILGLLDSKLNILAFCQNIAQIVCSDQFLNPEFAGSLVFSQSAVRHLKAVCPDEFRDLKRLQAELMENDLSIRLLREVDDTVGFYMDTLLDNNSIGLVKLIGSIPSGLPDLSETPHYTVPSDLKGSLDSLTTIFGLIEKYFTICEGIQESRALKKEAKGQKYTKSNAHQLTKAMALKKIIRIYREENDPIVMIKTAQNALNYIISKGLDSDHDVLHIMSVNYGGCLVGSFAKHTFSRTVKHGRIMCNPGNVIYSIYDVKNANSFSTLTDYPFARVLRDRNVDSSVKRSFSDRNWILVFDDNTHSGQTLDDIRILAEQSEFYGRVDLFPCRASAEFTHYKKELPETEMLAMLACCAVFARKSKSNPNKIRYKEALGSIIGNRMFKILRQIDSPSK